MEQLHINLIKKQPVNILRLVAGLAMIGATVYLAYFSSQTRFTNTHLTIFFIGGLYYVLIGAGFNPVKVFAKAYIKIDKQIIVIKPSMFKKAIELNWDQVSEVNLNISTIRFKLNNSVSIQFEYDMLDEDMRHELKTRIALIAKSLDIKVS